MATQTSAVNAPSTKPEDQAATAALYATKHDQSHGSDGNRFLDNDSRLSSAGAAASLKYASPRDLPSFPSLGLKKDDSAAGTAASLGWANQKSFEHWKPDPSASASKAAFLAKDYKAPPLWQPEQSANGAKAALLAAKDGGKVEIWKPEASAWGNSAANQAFKTDRNKTLSSQLDYGYTAVGRQGSLMAATGAMSGTRKRSESTPVPKPTYPDEANASTNALSAATHANNPSRKTGNEYSATSGSIPFTNMPKEMFTSHPPIAPEVDEKRRSDVLHASAVAMARQMYSYQQKQIDQTAKVQGNVGQSAALSAHGRQQSSLSSDETQPMRFNSLQEAAQRLAQERLSKLHDEHAQNREYRNYYGETSRPTSKLSIRGRVRRRASSDGTLDEDREQSQKIRAQMSIFSSSLSQVDAKKRQKDREALMAIAQRNVTARLQGMDERVFKDTGKVAPSILNDWEVKAHAAAQQKSDNRMENYGKIDIGGGKFVDQSVVNAAAARNVQPVLDEINEKVEKERIRQAELKLEQEAQRRSAETTKNRENELKEINRKLREQDKEEEKARKEEERAKKEEEKARKEAEKAAKAEQKRTVKEKRKSKEVPVVTTAVEEEPTVGTSESKTEEVPENHKAPVIAESSHTTTATPAGYVAPTGMRTSMEMQTEQRLEEIIKEGEKSPKSSEPQKGVKGWFKTKFARRQSKSQNIESKDGSGEKPFVDGVNIIEPINTTSDRPSSSAREAIHQEESKEVNVEEDLPEERAGRSKHRASSVSSVSVLSDDNEVGKQVSKDEDFEEARDHFDEELVPPPAFVAAKSASPVRDSKFHEEM